MKKLLCWWKRRKLRQAQEDYARAKAELEAWERLGARHCWFYDKRFKQACGNAAALEERVEILMREQ